MIEEQNGPNGGPDAMVQDSGSEQVSGAKGGNDVEQVTDADAVDDKCEDYGYHELGGEDENSDEDKREQEDEGAVDSKDIDGEQDEVEELGFADL